VLLSKNFSVFLFFVINFFCRRKAEFALQKVQMQELTEKGMVFDRFAVAYGNKNKRDYYFK
jgi:hypothetical protein